MFDEYSIERRAEQIFDPRTKEYFSEVLSGYMAGNYRSAVVMLWSVAICDLLFKLQNLVELHEDTKAKGILDEIKEMRRKNNRSSEWETRLVELAGDKTKLLDVVERKNLLHLQQQRHLAAHPIVDVDTSDELHRPNRDTVRALIRNTLDGLLTKAPILSTKIVDRLVDDIAHVSEILPGNEKLKAYLESKYYSRFNPAVEKAVFRALWKFVFRLTDDPCDKNRAINYRALRLLYERNPAQFKAQIEGDKDYFSSIAKDIDPVSYLIRFLSGESQIFDLLEDHAKAIVQHAAKANAQTRCLAWFVAGSMEEHGKQLGEWIVNDNPDIDKGLWEDIRRLSDSPEWMKTVIRLANKYYVTSPNYNSADRRFQDAIAPNLRLYKLDDCEDLIAGICRNDQTYNRWLSKRDHQALYEAVLNLDEGFDFSSYSLIFWFMDSTSKRDS